MNIQTKEDIIEGLNANVNAFTSYISSLNKEEFEITPGNKWSAGQNLEHLIRSIKPLQLAYSLPKFILKLSFGKANRPSRNFDGLITKYKTKLQQGGRASGRFIPPFVAFDKKNELIARYQREKDKLIKKIRNQSESELDKYILPHPLLGKLTLREMLFFTIYHNEHHLKICEERRTIHS